MFHYRHHGFGVASALKLSLHEAAPTQELACTIEIRESIEIPAFAPLLDVPLPDLDGEIRFRLFNAPGGAHAIWVERAGVYVVSARSIVACPLAGGRDGLFHHFLVTSAFALWAEREGHPVLHGAGVATPEGAAALVGDSGAGKSVLVSACHRRGIRVLSDDMAVARAIGPSSRHWLLYPGSNDVRLWPEAVAMMWGGDQQWPRQHARIPKRIVTVSEGPLDPVPLRAILLLRRGVGPSPAIHRLSPADGIRALMRHTYSPRTIAAAGLRPGRLQRLAQLVAGTCVAELHYPDGYRNVDAAADCVGQAIASSI